LKIGQSEAKIDSGGHLVPSNRTKKNSYFIYSVISTILFVAVPLIFIYIQVSDSGSHEPLVNISVIMTYNLDR
jgi:hypothetical protein